MCLVMWSRLLNDLLLLCPQYEVKAPMPSVCFRTACKQMMKMHEAISELLPEEQMQVRLNTTHSSVVNIIRCGSLSARLKFRSAV